jgi:uncharacterized membrane protein (UPF0127 family)
MKTILLVILFFVFCSVGFALDTKMVCLKGICIRAELAASDRDREKGLMSRSGMQYDRGMLFIFKEDGRHTFWMKNMEFPLDIIWINRDKIIVDIRTSVFPCHGPCERLIPAVSARYVLEVNAGLVQKQGIKIGEKVDF